MHTNYYKIVKELKSFKILLFAPICFGLHKPSSENSQACALLKLQCWYRLHISLFEVIGIVTAYAATIPITSNNYICNQSQHCNVTKHRLRAP